MSIASFFAIGLFVFGIIQNKFSGFSYFAAANVFLGIGLLLLALRDILPDIITIVVANTMVIVGSVLYYEGIRRFLGVADQNNPIGIVAVLLNFVLFYYYTFESPSVNNRIFVITLISALLSALCVRELVRRLPDYWYVPGIMTALVFGGYGIFQVFRFIWTLGETPIQSFMSAGTIHAFAFIFMIILILGSAFGFIWMVNKKLEYYLTELAMHDPLTNILNRRGLELLASQEFAKLGRAESVLTIVMIDIDHFKQINDQHGHSVGDVLLTDFAKLIQSGLRPYDIFGRIGGEEFLILLPNTKLDLALTLANRIRQKIENHVFNIDAIKIQITASFGVSNYLPETVTLDKLIPYADKALFQSKKQGRNHVSTFIPQSGEFKQKASE